ncbi:hypothetical protein DL98DRAFT_661592 [Cadophora sp. DSE1049]|nr:hypothetical protein DL98DRAFT_661592 [Cadophora sp. DSE1049]
MGFLLTPAEKAQGGLTKLFAPLSPTQQAILDRWNAILRLAERRLPARDRTPYILVSTAPNPNNLFPDAVRFLGSELLKKRKFNFGTEGPNVLFYLQMMCSYINQQAGRGGTAAGTQRNVPLVATWEFNISGRDDNDEHPSKDSLFSMIDKYHLDYAAHSKAWSENMLGRENVFQIRHIFIPVYYSIHYLNVVGQRTLTQKNCTFTATNNAMCIAFGYPLDYNANDLEVMGRRRNRVSSEMIEGAFSGNWTSDYHYPISGIVPDTSRDFGGWMRIPYDALMWLPIEAAAHRNFYSGYTIDSLAARCNTLNSQDIQAGNLPHYPNFETWYQPYNTLAPFITQVEVADFLIINPTFHVDALAAQAQAIIQHAALDEARRAKAEARRAAAQQPNINAAVVSLDSESGNDDDRNNLDTIQEDNRKLLGAVGAGGQGALEFYERYFEADRAAATPNPDRVINPVPVSTQEQVPRPEEEQPTPNLPADPEQTPNLNRGCATPSTALLRAT